MTRTLPILVGLALLMGTAALARAEAPAAAPAPAPAAKAAAPAPAPKTPAPAAQAAGLSVVKSLEGTVECRTAVGQPWQAVKVGQPLAEGTDLRTGFRARCVLDMGQSLVQVDPLTVVRIGELRKDGDKVRTRLYMKQGSTQAIVEKGGPKNDFAIVTPSATLSVRGTWRVGCQFSSDQGGSYSLSDSGLLGVQNNQTGQQTGLTAGESTGDNAQPGILFLAGQQLPILLDKGGYDPGEQWAAMRWNTSTPFAAGLGGPTGPTNLTGILGAQETPIIIIPCDHEYEERLMAMSQEGGEPGSGNPITLGGTFTTTEPAP